MNTEGIRFRPAQVKDCETIARLYAMSSEGVANYIWSQLAEPGQDPLTVGRRRYEREDTPFSFRNCTIAERDGRILGMLVAFPTLPHAHTEPETDPVLAPYAKLEEPNSYYVCGLAIFPEARGKGLGRRFMALAEEQAKAQGFTCLSLIVAEQNTPALHLYQGLGYEEKNRAAIYPHPLIHMSGDALLMVKDMSSTH